MARLLHIVIIAAALVLLPHAGSVAQQAGEAHPQDMPDDAGRPTGELLDRLFGRLHGAEDEKSAKAIEQAIWKLWTRSPSATAEALIGQAEKAIEASQFATAISILDTAVDLAPDFAEAWNRRATAYYLDRQFDRSLADIERVLELEPRHFGALAGLGVIRREKGDHRGALQAFRRALAIHPFLNSARRAVKELELQVEQDI